MSGLRRIGVALLCTLAVTAGCDRDAEAPAPGASSGSLGANASAGPSGGPVSAPGSAPTGPGGPGTSAPPIVTGSSKPPAGGGVAAAPPPCAELKPLIDRHLTAVRITREAPAGQSGACYLIATLQNAQVQAQIDYGHNGSVAKVRKATGAGCAAAVRPLELHYKTALGCDNATGAVHSGAGLAQGGSFAVAVITVTGDAAGTAQQRATVSDTAQKLAATILQQIG